MDFAAGWASFDASEYDRALRLYLEQGVRLRRCDDLDDDGIVIMGRPIYEDISEDVRGAPRGKN